MSDLNPNQCPKCGVSIPENAPQGLCPACVLMGAETTPDPSRNSRNRASAPGTEEIAPHFPELEILELIGAGGMGAVYKARQPHLGRLVALKVLPVELGEDPAFVERFSREARVLAKLNHPNIVTVFDSGMAGPFCFLMMELVDGVNLRQAMQAGGFSAPESLDLVQEICAALKFAHTEGILHRDIKPENVLIDTKGRVKIADFGIAKLMGEGEPESVTLTVEGSALGSPHYMAPEQLESPGDVDQRADIYSLGVVFYELLTGELPMGRFAPPSERSETDPRLDSVVMRTLERQREQRYQNVGEVQTSVASITKGGTPIPPTPPASAAAGARFSLTSAILTGISAFAGLPVFLVLMQQMGDSGVGPNAIVLAVLFVLTSAIPAILGTIFGFVALSDFRRSGGRKTGFGLAMLGALTWPTILIVAVTSMAFIILAKATQLGPLEGLALVVLFNPLALFFFGRGVGRWATQNKKWSSGGLRAASIGLAVVLLALVGWLAMPGEGDDGHYSDGPSPDFEMAGTSEKVMSSSSNTPATKQLIEMPFSVPEGFAVALEIVRVNDIGEGTVTELGWAMKASELQPLTGVFRVDLVGSIEYSSANRSPEEERGAKRNLKYSAATDQGAEIDDAEA
ncbi:MAG: protein kinase, partial [Verrucomicrobiota bacterium]